MTGRAAAQPFGIVHEPIERHFIQMWAVSEPSDQVVLVGPDDWGRLYMEQIESLPKRGD
jgi:hypothetical protein